MKNTLYIICLLLLAVPAAFADADIDAVQLNRQNGELVFRIDASSQFQFTHQTEEAKDGKPFRVIIDLFPAIHKLGQKSFFDLPPKMVKAIRSSQYAVEPNKTVRVVLDLNEESVYRIEKTGNSVFVYIPDSKGSDFPVWSSIDNLKPQSPAEKPPVLAKKEEPKPQKTVAAVSKPKEEAKQTPQVFAAPETTFYKPQSSGPVEQDWLQPKTQRPIVVKAEEKPVVVKAEEKPVVVKAEEKPVVVKAEEKPVVVKAEEKPAPEKKVSAQSSETAKPVAEMIKTSQPTSPDKPVKKEENKPAEKAAPKTELAASGSRSAQNNNKAAAPVVNPEPVQTDEAQPESADNIPAQENPAQLVVQEQPEEEQDEEDDKSTSRFRRQPAFPAKLKGTIVAEFPKRMVIKYTPGISRDPFASLMDETKQSDGPMAKKIPDVETTRLVGVLESSDGQNRALLEDMEGYGFILKSGDKVKKGYVSQIYSDKALFQIFEYGWSRTVALHLEDNE